MHGVWVQSAELGVPAHVLSPSTAQSSSPMLMESQPRSNEGSCTWDHRTLSLGGHGAVAGAAVQGVGAIFVTTRVLMGDVASLCVSKADDCRLLAKLPKVKCLRNRQREGKGQHPEPRLTLVILAWVRNPGFGRWESDGAGGKRRQLFQWMEHTGQSTDNRRHERGLEIGMDFTPLSLKKKKKGSIKISEMAQL